MNNTVKPDLWACQVAGPGFEQNAAAQAVQATVAAARPTGAAAVVAGAVTSNISSATMVARLKAGEALLVTVKALLVKVVPEQYAKHLDNEFILAAVANAAAALIQQLRPHDAKAQAVANLLIEAAWVKIAARIDIDELFEKFSGEIDLSSLGF